MDTLPPMTDEATPEWVKPGSLVQLKGQPDSPRMTVMALDHAGRIAQCAWHVGARVERKNFEIVGLMAATEPKTTDERFEEAFGTKPGS